MDRRVVRPGSHGQPWWQVGVCGIESSVADYMRVCARTLRLCARFACSQLLAHVVGAAMPTGMVFIMTQSW